VEVRIGDESGPKPALEVGERSRPPHDDRGHESKELDQPLRDG
jgi:hypothetical protein